MENIRKYVIDFSQLNTLKENTLRNKITKEMIKEMKKSFKKANLLLREQKVKEVIEDYLFMKRNINEPLFESKFVIQEIKDYIHKEVNYVKKYKFNVKNRQIEVLFYLEKNNTMNDELIKIITILLFLSTYALNGCSKHLTIHIIPSKITKELPNETIEILDAQHVNSAVTTSCTTNGSIIIYRKEEYIKILIHELFHVLGLDFSSYFKEDYIQLLREKLNIQSDYLIYEAYNEFWATIINTLFYSVIHTREESILDNYNKYINIEKTFSLFQMIKILSFMHLTYDDLWSNNEKNKIMRKMLYKEQTNVLAYYIIKTILLMHDVKVFEWCLIHNINILYFSENLENIKLLTRFIIKLSNSRKMLNNVQYGEAIFKKELRQHNNRLLKTTRMTILDI
jgi:hypothetical protein